MSTISKSIFQNTNFDSIVKLGELCNITTGKLDANAMVENGLYPFFTCAEMVYRINHYNFDTEALMIAGNGNVGYIHYYKGKFNAYQRTYVLNDFSCNIKYAKYYLQTMLPKRIEQEKNAGNIPYIVLGTLANMKIGIVSNKLQNKITTLLSSFDDKINLEVDLLKAQTNLKKYLLSNLFV